MRRGKRIGSCDKLVLWDKPQSRPRGLSEEEFTALPKNLVLREVHYYIAIPGFRTKQVTLITTLLDAVEYPISSLLQLYGLRWEVELDLRHLKTTLLMEHLLDLLQISSGRSSKQVKNKETSGHYNQKPS